MTHLCRLLLALAMSAPSLSAMYRPAMPTLGTPRKAPEPKGSTRPAGVRLLAGAGALTLKPAAAKPCAPATGVRLIGPPAGKPAEPPAATALAQAGRQALKASLAPAERSPDRVKLGEASQLVTRRLPRTRPRAGSFGISATAGEEEPRVDLGALPASQGAGVQRPRFRVHVSRPLEQAGGTLTEAQYSTTVHLCNSTDEVLCLGLPAAGGKASRALVHAEYMVESTELEPGLEESYDLLPGETVQMRAGTGTDAAAFPITREDGSPYATLEVAFD